MKSQAAKRSRSFAPVSIGAPFDGRFFLSIFKDRIRSLCRAQAGEVPIILLQLADGRALDLCHVQMLGEQWLAAAVYRDGSGCEKMDIVFVPYAMIAGITLSKREASERRAGFHLEKSLAALTPGNAKATHMEAVK